MLVSTLHEKHSNAMSIRLTPAAVQAVHSALQERGHGLGVRLDISVGGATGLAYRLQFADAAGDNDLAFSQDGICILSDMRNLPYLEGLVLDYGAQGDTEGFFVHHGETCGDCGCGCGSTEACG